MTTDAVEQQTKVPTPTLENPFRTPAYIAEVVGVKVYTVREWLKSGKLKGFKVGPDGAWKILHTDFVDFLQGEYGQK